MEREQHNIDVTTAHFFVREVQSRKKTFDGIIFGV